MSQIASSARDQVRVRSGPDGAMRVNVRTLGGSGTVRAGLGSGAVAAVGAGDWLVVEWVPVMWRALAVIRGSSVVAVRVDGGVRVGLM